MQYNNGIRHIAYNLLNITNQFCVTMIGYQSLNTGMGSGTSSTIGDHLPAKYDFLMAYLRKLPSMVTLIWNLTDQGGIITDINQNNAMLERMYVFVMYTNESDYEDDEVMKSRRLATRQVLEIRRAQKNSIIRFMFYFPEAEHVDSQSNATAARDIDSTHHGDPVMGLVDCQPQWYVQATKPARTGTFIALALMAATAVTCVTRLMRQNFAMDRASSVDRASS